MFNIKFKVFLLIFFLSTAESNSRFKGFAFCLNSKGDVIRKGIARSGNLLKGDVIYENDKITVGENSYVSFLNTHERSEVRVFENSSIKLLKSNKQPEDNEEIYEIVIFGGKVIVNKIEYNSKALIINSPSSSVFSKNSHFLVEYRNKSLYNDFSYCVFTLIEGNILIENSESKKMIFLNRGETVISTKRGKFYPLETFRDGSRFDNAFISEN